ncbi:MAG: hypothetical protein O7E52_13950 [Candidatus Poribacteria bacterium]|nr:hypothetical protein [Candidatus Poribacteria bacterium]
MADAGGQYRFTISGIDTFGNQKIPSQQIIDMLGVTEGTHFEPGTLRMRRMRENVEALGNFSHVHVALVLYPDGKAYLTVDVIEKGSERQLIFRPPPTGVVDLPGEVLALYDEYLRLWGRRVRNQTAAPMPGTGTSDCGHRFSRDSELRSLEEQFIELVPKHQDALIDALAGARSPKKRRVAAAMLGWSSEPESTVCALTNALSDLDVVVRSNAGLSLVYTSRIAIETGAFEIPLQPILDMFHLPFTTDRQKAALVLAELAKSKNYRPTILQEAGRQLMQMLALKQPSNRDAAHEVLRQMSGLDYTADQAGAWQEWYQQATRGIVTPLPEEGGNQTET